MVLNWCLTWGEQAARIAATRTAMLLRLVRDLIALPFALISKFALFIDNAFGFTFNAKLPWHRSEKRFGVLSFGLSALLWPPFLLIKLILDYFVMPLLTIVMAAVGWLVGATLGTLTIPIYYMEKSSRATWTDNLDVTHYTECLDYSNEKSNHHVKNPEFFKNAKLMDLVFNQRGFKDSLYAILHESKSIYHGVRKPRFSETQLDLLDKDPRYRDTYDIASKVNEITLQESNLAEMDVSFIDMARSQLPAPYLDFEEKLDDTLTLPMFKSDKALQTRRIKTVKTVDLVTTPALESPETKLKEALSAK